MHPCPRLSLLALTHCPEVKLYAIKIFTTILLSEVTKNIYAHCFDWAYI